MDPVQGRFLSRDPLGTFPQANLFAYGRNSPATCADPTGRYLVFPDLKTAVAWNAMLEDEYGIKTGGVYHLPEAGNYRYYVLVDPKDPNIAKIPDDKNRWGQTLRAILRNETDAIGYSPSQDWGVIGLDSTGEREPLTREDLFRITAARNGVAEQMIDFMMKSTDFEKHWVPFKEGLTHNACERWAYESYKRLHTTEEDEPTEFAEYYPGKLKVNYVWFDKIDLWGRLRGTDHVVVRITFPDGSVFYFDSRWFTKSHIALPADVPASYRLRSED
jgi:hypothetical protein